MKSVIIFYEHKARELNSILLLKEELEKRNLKVLLYSYVFEYYEALDYMKKHPADFIVVPAMYMLRTYKLIVPFAKINRNCSFINLHHEQISSDAILSSVMPRHETAKNNIYHFSWSENFKRQLMSYGVHEENIRVDGIGRLDSIYAQKGKVNNKDAYAKEFGLDPSKKWILYCETRDWVWENVGYEKFLRKTYGDDLYEEYYYDQKTSLDHSLNDFNNLPDSFFDEFEVIYRPHPGIAYKPEINKNIKIISKYSVYDWFTCIDANVVSYSTAAYESEAFGIPTFIDTVFEMNPKFALGGFDKYTHLSSLKEIKEKLATYDHTAKIYEEYIGIVDGNSTKRMADSIIEIMIDPNSIKPELVEMNNMTEFLKRIRELIFRFMYHTGLVKIFKWPRILYDLYTDIPYDDNPKLH